MIQLFQLKIMENDTRSSLLNEIQNLALQLKTLSKNEQEFDEIKLEKKLKNIITTKLKKQDIDIQFNKLDTNKNKQYYDEL